MDHPLAEIFGFPACNDSKEAVRFQKNRLCPFNNRVPSCTKDKANNPLGVCSIFANDNPIITCPVRFRESWLIAEDAAGFFFGTDAKWTSLSEIKLNDKNGKSAGNIDLVLVSYDDKGKILDFGSLEIQAVYISGNIRDPFETYIDNPLKRKEFSWEDRRNYPKPDFLSTFKKSLIPKIICKGGVLSSWGKKTAIIVDTDFFSSLPKFQEVAPAEADLGWLVYNLRFDVVSNCYRLNLHKTVCTKFEVLVDMAGGLSIPQVGSCETFVKKLKEEIGRDWDY
jgi:hypothetical protein